MRCIAQAFLSPNFGAFATPVPWQVMQVVSYTFLPSGLTAAACATGPAAAGSLNFAPAALAI